MDSSWAGVLYGGILTEVATTDRTQWGLYQRPPVLSDSPVQTDLAWLIRCLLYGQTKKQRNKNITNFICFPARAQAFSWLSSVTGLQSKRDKNNCPKSSFVQTSSMNEDKIFHAGSMIGLITSRCSGKWARTHPPKERLDACDFLCWFKPIMLSPADFRLAKIVAEIITSIITSKQKVLPWSSHSEAISTARRR